MNSIEVLQHKMDELKSAIENEYDYYLDVSNSSLDIKAAQQILAENGYLLTGQHASIMVYEKPNEYDTFKVKDRYLRYMNTIAPMLNK